MKPLDVQARLEYGRAAVAVLRALKIADRTTPHPRTRASRPSDPSLAGPHDNELDLHS